jgi:hypothetical protein
MSGVSPHFPTQPPLPATTLSDILQQLPQDAHWAIARCSPIDDNGTYLANAIRAGTAVAVSDGSLKNRFGTAAFTVEGPTRKHQITGVNIVPGPIFDGQSYRCEISGLIGTVLVINAICRFHHITSGRVTIACDNDAAIHIFDHGYLPNPQKDSYDLVMALWKLIRESPIEKR